MLFYDISILSRTVKAAAIPYLGSNLCLVAKKITSQL